MTYPMITMTLTAINTVALIIVGILIMRKNKKIKRPVTLDEIWRNFASKPEHREELNRIVEKYMKNETANKS